MCCPDHFFSSAATTKYYSRLQTIISAHFVFCPGQGSMSIHHCDESFYQSGLMACTLDKLVSWVSFLEGHGWNVLRTPIFAPQTVGQFSISLQDNKVMRHWVGKLSHEVAPELMLSICGGILGGMLVIRAD